MDEPSPADMATTDEWFGRLTAQEFLLELLWTNFIRVTGGDDAAVQQLAEDCARVMDKPWRAAEGFEPARSYAVHQHAISHVENFWQKVRDRLEG